MKKDKNILVVMPVKDEHKKTLEQHSQGNKFIYSSYDNVTQEMVTGSKCYHWKCRSILLTGSKKLRMAAA